MSCCLPPVVPSRSSGVHPMRSCECSCFRKECADTTSHDHVDLFRKTAMCNGNIHAHAQTHSERNKFITLVPSWTVAFSIAMNRSPPVCGCRFCVGDLHHSSVITCLPRARAGVFSPKHSIYERALGTCLLLAIQLGDLLFPLPQEPAPG